MGEPPVLTDAPFEIVTTIGSRTARSQWPSPRWTFRQLGLIALVATTANLMSGLAADGWLQHTSDLAQHPVQCFACTIRTRLARLGFYLIAVVVLTSNFRHRLGWRRSKMLHFSVYGGAVCIFTHGILASPNLYLQPIQPLDGEKLLVEGCLLIVAAAPFWAWRSRVRQVHGRAAHCRRKRPCAIGPLAANNRSTS